jgi:hypothetical protein
MVAFVRRPLVMAAFVAIVWAQPAFAQASAPATPPPTGAEAEATLKPAPKTPESILQAPPPEAPPPLPRKKGFVLESSLGVLGFLGEFRHVAPPAYWMHMQFGYEALFWLMVFGEGELAFTDTSVSHDATHVRAFPVFGFGGGLRATIHPMERFAFYVQASIDALEADIAVGALGNLGYRDAESLNPSFGGRLGLEYYQLDRHLALGVAGGIRDAQGFARHAGTSDAPLMWDGAAVLRYTF